MSKYIFLVIFFLSVVPKSFSQQSLSDYSYVIVPEQWEFLNEKDKYQLNSIAKFLFNKHGFNAFFSEEAPAANRCDGLYADLIKVTAIIRTKFILVLKDCNGFEVYRSPEGITKLKEFRKAYQDALRKTFEYFEPMEIKQKDIRLMSENTISEKPIKKIAVEKTSKTKPNVAQKTEVSSKPVKTEISVGEVLSRLPKSKFSSYTFKGSSYLLRKTDEGYSFYEETTTNDDGLLLIGKIALTSDAKLIFTNTFGTTFNASFDASENLTIQNGTTTDVYQSVH
jgi:hypothetical protein